MRRLLMTDVEVAEAYSAGESIQRIQELNEGVTRATIYNALKRAGVAPVRRKVYELSCLFCGETYDKPRSHVKGQHGGYCSVQCFHASRSKWGEYSKVGGSLTRVKDSLGYADEVNHRKFGRLAHKALEDAGIVLKPGEVVHHKDGDRRNMSPDNLQVFKSQSAHMKYHHSLRGNGPVSKVDSEG